MQISLTNRSILLAHLAQLVSVIIISVGFMVQKSLVREFAAPTILLWQFLGASLVMWLICLVRHYHRTVSRRFAFILLWGGMAPGLVMIFTIYGGARTDGVSLAVMWGLLPLLVPVLGFLLLNEKAHWSLALGAAIGFAGLIVLSLSREAAGTGSMAGNALVLLAVLCASFSQIVGRRMNRGAIPWFQVATLQVTGALIAIIGLSLATGTFTLLPLTLPLQGVAMAYLVLVMTVLNYALFNYALRHLPVAWVSIYVALNPAFGTLAAIVILDAQPRPLDWIGIAIIISGVTLPHIHALLRRRSR
tara:strand:+ start:1087 stop:1998 length:912 start_codon:yes stop_codon:yes gene_type:complete